MSTTINNAIPFAVENAVDPAAGLNIAINTIDALLQVVVLAVGANTPPASPANGARYIVGTTPTGAWAGQANRLARRLDGTWQFFNARHALNAADGLLYVRPGSAWVAASSGGGATFTPVLEDSTNSRLLTVADAGIYLRFTGAGESTVTIPSQSTQDWSSNTELHIRRSAIGNLTLVAGSGVALNPPSGGSLVMESGMTVTLKRVASNVWDVIGQTVTA